MKIARTICIGALLSLALALRPDTSVLAQQTSSQPADLVSNERVIYTLPDVGSITPDNPLFILKQMRDSLLLTIPQDKVDKIKLLIQMNDKYTVYADKLAHLSKPERSVNMFQMAMSYQSQTIEILKEIYSQEGTSVPEQVIDLRNIAVQSNIKQAETIRSLIDLVPASEQQVLLILLDKNIQLRKKLQSI